MKVESIKDYVNVLDDNELMKLAYKIYMITDLIKEDYPNHKNWFFNNQLSESLCSGKRNILFVKVHDEIVGVANLLKTAEEKKICTIYVKDGYRNQGIGSMLVEESMKWLDTRNPILTITKDKYDMYKYFFDKFNWKLTGSVDGFYKEGVKELFLNVPDSNKIYRQ